jgi:cell division septation protein DedD
MRTAATTALLLLLLTGCASVRHPNTFNVQVATYWQPQEAWKLQEQLAYRGYDAFVEETMITFRSARPQSMIIANDKGVTYPTPSEYRVRVGPFPNESAAQQAQTALRAAGFKAYVVHH